MCDDTLMSRIYDISKEWSDDTSSIGLCDGLGVSQSLTRTTNTTATTVEKHRYGKGF